MTGLWLGGLWISVELVIWTIAAVVGLPAAALSVGDSIADLRIHADPGTHRIAVGNIRRELFRASELVGALIVAVLSLYAQSAVPVAFRRPPITPIGEVLSLLLVWITVGVAISTVLDRRLRRAVLQGMRDEVSERATNGYTGVERRGRRRGVNGRRSTDQEGGA